MQFQTFQANGPSVGDGQRNSLSFSFPLCKSRAPRILPQPKIPAAGKFEAINDDDDQNPSFERNILQISPPPATMAKEEVTPQTPRRTTRSSLATPSKTPTETPIPPPTHDLLFPEHPIDLDTLIFSLPGRRAQINDILRLIGPPNSPTLPILLHGGASTGKTSTILQTFRHLNRPFVYVGCRSCYSPRTLFESVLNQLLLHRRCVGNGYASAKRCDRVSEFVTLLRDAIVQAVEAVKGTSKRRVSKDSLKGGNGGIIYLIFDNLEMIRAWDKGSVVISLIFRLYDLVRIPEIGLIYISSSAPDAYYTNTGSVEPVTVYFPDYMVEDLHTILIRNQEHPKLYSSFLSIVLKPFFRITRRIDELAIAFQPLFKKYCEPLTDLNVIPNEAMKRRLFDRIQTHLATSMNEIFRVPHHLTDGAIKEGTFSKKGNVRRTVSREAAEELDFHMSTSAKYLLLSAFLASRNPATLDASLFDSTGGFNNQKRKRSSHTSMDRKDAIAQEKLMKGPGTFPLERLLAIFQCITSVADIALEGEFPEDETMTEGGNVGLMSDVLLQLSTLCNANFICKSGSCPLEGSTRYRSTIDEEIAVKVARTVNFPLSSYLYRR